MGGNFRKEDGRKLEFEARAGHPRARVAGVDEVGRGCLAGPVVAAAVCLPAEIDWTREAWLLEVDDSKRLTAETRERLAIRIEAWAAASAVALATVEEIDRVNIYHASHLAMARAVDALVDCLGARVVPDHVLVDGNALPRGLRVPATAVVKGDQRCLSIACASILAKVWRDRRMAELDREVPGYGLSAHKGYATPAHRAALRRLGASALHRRSFAPVRDCP